MQKTTFPFELVIGEDCSTDGTREIVLDYAQKYPEIIRDITSESNVGMFENSKRTTLACLGKYMAICEGDDYWTDPYKLQKQVDFLEMHPDYSMCCHASKIVIEGCERQTEIVRLADTDKTFTLDDFLAPMSKNFIRTETVVLKSAVVRELPERPQRIVVGDYPLFLLLAYHGNIRYINQVMSVYRKHGGGYWTSNSRNAEFLEKYYLSTVEMYQGFDEYSDYIYHDKIQKRIAYRYYQLIQQFFSNEAQCQKYLWKYWTY
jgi:glycosyltransferase involved in cell wall biosynthesis